jgi:phage tail-like protein
MSDTTVGFNGEIPNSTSFLFEVDGVQIGMFSEVSGLELRVEVETYKEGGVNGYVHQLPGHMTWPNIVLRRGVTNSDALFAWAQKSAGDQFTANNNKLTRNSGAITAIGSDLSRLRAWELQGVFAVRWIGPKFATSANDTLVEELELAHHGFTSKTY